MCAFDLSRSSSFPAQAESKPEGPFGKMENWTKLDGRFCFAPALRPEYHKVSGLAVADSELPPGST